MNLHMKKNITQHFVSVQQVVDVGAGVILTRVALTTLQQRPRVVVEALVA